MVISSGSVVVTLRQSVYQQQFVKQTACSRLSASSKLISLHYGSVALLVARRTNDRKVVGSRPTKVVCITVLTGNRMGVNCPL